jgi:ABC-2 type transport system ATP-binding protein
LSDSDTTTFIHLDHITRWYGNHLALDNVSLDLRPGRVGLLGPNGAGKSSLLKILLGLLEPSSGTGSVLGHAIAPPSPEDQVGGLAGALRGVVHDFRGAGASLRRLIGYMPEADALVPGLNGAEYVALAGELYGMPRKQAQRRAHEVLTCLELEDARYRKLEEYSLGMKQRLKLAQALVHDPPVLLLDEPTSGLDPSGRDAMLRLLLSLARDHGKSFILCTHLLGDVERVCETVVVLHKGQVLRHGSVQELRVARQDRYVLQIQGEAQGFLEDLRLEGVQLLHDNGRGEYRVAVPAGWTTRTFFVLADHSNVVLRALRRDDEDLEELFHRVIRERDAIG